MSSERAAAKLPVAERSPGVQARWWEDGVIYEVYPLSFMDADGDGYGDLAGLASRLDYVQSLGATVIWLTPVHPSPLVDFGYDVADYTAIHPLFGTLEDFDALVAEIHRRGMRIVMDLVANHTSDRHPWFIASRSSRDDPKRDWYIWRDPAPDGGPPNNWVSYLGSGWTLDPATSQDYFHQFHEAQPELNYGNPAVLAAMLDVMRFWLDRGVDGFRVDVIACLAKDPGFRDDPPNPGYRPGMTTYHSVLHRYTRNQPAVHEIVRAMRRLLDEYGDRALIGELDPLDGLPAYYGAGLDECHLPFNFTLIFEPWDAGTLHAVIDAYDASLPPGAWPNWVLGNHDQPRVCSRLGRAQARVAHVLLMTLRGTPVCYYGDELGMADTPVAPDRVRDLAGFSLEAGSSGRDPQRTPMQWGAGPNAGFCLPGVAPWLPVAPDRDVVNVAAEDADPRSMLALFRRLIGLRREHPTLVHGTYRSLDPGVDGVLAFERVWGDSRILVCLNLSARPVVVGLDGCGRGDVLVSTHLDRTGPEALDRIALRADEAVVIRLPEAEP